MGSLIHTFAIYRYLQYQGEMDDFIKVCSENSMLDHARIMTHMYSIRTNILCVQKDLGLNLNCLSSHLNSFVI